MDLVDGADMCGCTHLLDEIFDEIFCDWTVADTSTTVMADSRITSVAIRKA
eukprot:COSAG02_NODE_725_length_18021_cov_392.218279_11_plen_51_part_00